MAAKSEKERSKNQVTRCMRHLAMDLYCFEAEYKNTELPDAEDAKGAPKAA